MQSFPSSVNAPMSPQTLTVLDRFVPSQDRESFVKALGVTRRGWERDVKLWSMLMERGIPEKEVLSVGKFWAPPEQARPTPRPGVPMMGGMQMYGMPMYQESRFQGNMPPNMQSMGMPPHPVHVMRNASWDFGHPAMMPPGMPPPGMPPGMPPPPPGMSNQMPSPLPPIPPMSSMSASMPPPPPSVPFQSIRPMAPTPSVMMMGRANSFPVVPPVLPRFEPVKQESKDTMSKESIKEVKPLPKRVEKTKKKETSTEESEESTGYAPNRKDAKFEAAEKRVSSRKKQKQVEIPITLATKQEVEEEEVSMDTELEPDFPHAKLVALGNGTMLSVHCPCCRMHITAVTPCTHTLPTKEKEDLPMSVLEDDKLKEVKIPITWDPSNDGYWYLMTTIKAQKLRLKQSEEEKRHIDDRWYNTLHKKHQRKQWAKAAKDRLKLRLGFAKFKLDNHSPDDTLEQLMTNGKEETEEKSLKRAHTADEKSVKKLKFN